MQPNEGTFYQAYSTFKGYATPDLGPAEIRTYDDIVWKPGLCRQDMIFLEIGCGTGAFLSYLAAKGCEQFVGVDQDPHLADVIPKHVVSKFSCRDIWEALEDPNLERPDRVIALDVLEHFSPNEALRLLMVVRDKLRTNGRVIFKVPNTASPWGLQYQFGDLTHRTAFAPGSVRQLADAATNQRSCSLTTSNAVKFVSLASRKVL